MVASLEQLAESVPALRLLAEDAATALEGAGEGEDLDGDGLSDESEQQISSLLSQAQQLLEPTELPAIQLDPQNPQTDGSQPDIVVARQAVSALQSLATSLGVSASNQERLVEQAQQGLDFLLNADEEKAWEVDIDAVAEATFEGDVDQASRAVGLFNAYCARCHTSDWSAGVPYTLEVGAGGLGPAAVEQQAQCPVHRREGHDRLPHQRVGAQRRVRGQRYGHRPDARVRAGAPTGGHRVDHPLSAWPHAHWEVDVRELFRSILSANLTVTGVILVLVAIVVFLGAVYLLLYTNLGSRLAFLITGTATFGWITINSLLFVLYAPRPTPGRHRRAQCLRDPDHPHGLHARLGHPVRHVPHRAQPFPSRTKSAAPDGA